MDRDEIHRNDVFELRKSDGQYLFIRKRKKILFRPSLGPRFLKLITDLLSSGPIRIHLYLRNSQRRIKEILPIADPQI
jgi:hypothetical protein